MISRDYDRLLKFVVVGSGGIGGIGKSALIQRYADDTFSESYIMTIGVDFRIKTVRHKGKVMKLQIWDTSGAPRFRTITNSYYRGAMCLLILFDVTNEDSFGECDTFLESIKTHSSTENVILVGAKCDLASERVVNEAVANEWAYERGLPYYECSAKDGTGVDAVFGALIDEFCDEFCDESWKRRTKQAVERNSRSLKAVRSELLDTIKLPADICGVIAEYCVVLPQYLGDGFDDGNAKCVECVARILEALKIKTGEKDSRSTDVITLATHSEATSFTAEIKSVSDSELRSKVLALKRSLRELMAHSSLTDSLPQSVRDFAQQCMDL